MLIRFAGGIDQAGEIQWHLLSCLAFMWFVVFVCIRNGTKSTGKAAYITSTFPIVMLTILVCLGLSLDGAAEGNVTNSIIAT